MHRLWRYQLYALFFMLYALLKKLYALLKSNYKQNFRNPLVSQKIISTFAGYFRVQAFGPIQKEMISETQFLYRRGSAKGNHFFIYEAFQL